MNVLSESFLNEYQHDRVLDGFQKLLRPCALDKSSLGNGRVNMCVQFRHVQCMFRTRTFPWCQLNRFSINISTHVFPTV